MSDVLRCKRPRAMDGDAAVRARSSVVRNSDVNRARAARGEPPQLRCALMTENSAGATCLCCRDPTSFPAERGVANCIHPAMKGMESPGTDASVDCRAGQAAAHQFGGAEYAVLAAGEFGHPRFCGPDGRFVSHTETKSPSAAIFAPSVPSTGRQPPAVE